MLAAPLQPAAVLESRDLAQYRPVKDIETFKTLLPPAIEFIEGSSSGTLAVAEGKYQPINAGASGTPKTGAKPESRDARRVSQPETAKLASTPNVKSLYEGSIELSWPPSMTKGTGLFNTGNTCFLNSALQCLLHTPPLLHLLTRHNKGDKCAVQKPAFCMTCSMRDLMLSSYKTSNPIVPYAITSKLQHIAKHMRRGRQEDSHEFLRYAIDALQKSCLAGYPPKIDHKLAETTWVHKLFGGRLRSRVTCLSCGYNSDTFDSVLDLSVDIYNVHTLRDALRKFVAVDHLKGADKYKCEKCKKHVTADKQFTIHEAPTVLTVHLKRFTPMGRKMAHPVRYDEQLRLQPYMSAESFGPTYSLYGVISHAGGGPNSGHYYAYIKDSRGKWHEMNDDSVTGHVTAPLGVKNAYILFYIKEKGQELDAVIGAVGTQAPSTRKTSVVAGMKRKKTIESDDEDDEDARPPPSPNGRFIGPLLPSPVLDAKIAEARPDPQAEMLKRKIAERQTSAVFGLPASPTKPTSPSKSASPVKPSAALQSLSQYADDDEDEDDVGEVVEGKDASPAPASPAAVTALSPSSPLSPFITPKKATPPAPIPPSSFYASVPVTSKRRDSEDDRKRESPQPEDRDSLSEYARTPLSHASNFDRSGGNRSTERKLGVFSNPYSSNRMRNSLGSNVPRPKLYGKRGKPRAL